MAEPCSPTPTGSSPGIRPRRPRERPGVELFVGVAPRLPSGEPRRGRGTRAGYGSTSTGPTALDALWSFLAERPCHLLIASGGSGGVHAYRQLDQPLPAAADQRPADVREPIERAHAGSSARSAPTPTGDPTSPTPLPARSRLLRLAGTINHKSGAWAWVLEADLALPAYRIEALVGDLPDPPGASPPRNASRRAPSKDPYKRIPPPSTSGGSPGSPVPPGGLVYCPAAAHPDRTHPAASPPPRQRLVLPRSACGARGAIYDLASVIHGGPWGARCAARTSRAPAHA